MWNGLQMRNLVGVEKAFYLSISSHMPTDYSDYRLVFLNFSCHFPCRLPLVFTMTEAAEPLSALMPNPIRPFEG